MKFTQYLSNKKAQERRWLNDFIGLFEKGLNEMGIIETESPDFILYNDRKKISIEITSIVNPELKKGESLRQKIVDKAQEKDIDKYISGLHVHITFTECPIVCKGAELNKLVDQLREKVETLYHKFNIKEVQGYLSFEEKYDDSIITTISLSPNQRESSWYTFDSFTFPSVDPLWLVQRVSEKEKILKNYSSKFNENWLLLVANLWEGSSSYDFTSIKKAIKLQTRFHQVFIYLFDERKFIRLK